jgi:phage terminase large subunit-like protein
MTYVERASRYRAAILDGSIPACKWVKLACERDERDHARQDTDGFPYVFDPESAIRVCKAIEQFPHIKGPKAKQVRVNGRLAWQMLQRVVWQCWILCTVFGWKRLDGLRRFRTGLVMVPRKNGKSCFTAGVGLYMLTADGESGAEVHSAATTRDQAKIVAEAGYQMAMRSPQFLQYFGIVPRGPTSSRLDVPSTASSFGPLSADAGTLDGLNPHAALVDELHAHKTRHVWDVLESAMGARSQPLLWAISTAGSSIGGICYEVLSYLHKILEGVHVDETFFGIEYTVDAEDRWDDPAVWKKANPNYGVSVYPDDLERAAAAARQSPAAVNNFLTKRLNVWVQSESPWMSMEAWNACSNPAIEWADFLDAETFVAVDVAQSRDIAAIVAIGRRQSDGTVILKGQYFYPEDAVEASPIAMMSGWVREGHIIATDGSVTDYGRLQEEVERIVGETKAQMACFDRALAVHLMQNLSQKLGEASVLEVPQNVQTYDPAMKELERLVLSGRFEHDGNPVLTWMFSNVVVQRNYKDEIFPRKAGGKDSPNKIDGAAAALMGMSRLLAPSEDGSSVYDTIGIEEFSV